MRALAAEGAGVVLTSSALEEVLGNSDRVLALHDRRITAEERGEGIGEESMIRAIAGGAS